MVIELKLEKSDNLSLLLSNLTENINRLSLLKKREINKIDMSKVSWVCPLNILPIAVFVVRFSEKRIQS